MILSSNPHSILSNRYEGWGCHLAFHWGGWITSEVNSITFLDSLERTKTLLHYFITANLHPSDFFSGPVWWSWLEIWSHLKTDIRGSLWGWMMPGLKLSCRMWCFIRSVGKRLWALDGSLWGFKGELISIFKDHPEISGLKLWSGPEDKGFCYAVQTRWWPEFNPQHTYKDEREN